MHGALLIDKPEGITSADVIRQLKRRLGGGKLGHAGTLDPFATGLVVVLCGKATRLQDVIHQEFKSYEGIIRLGLQTNSDDITGRVLSEDESFGISDPCEQAQAIERLVGEFRGELAQVPPQVSAVHVDGVRSYKRVRQGETVELKPRRVIIDTIELSFLDPQRLSYRVHCSSGTYIRSLGRDIGAALGTVACVETLRRTTIGKFSVEQSYQIESINEHSELDSCIIPIDDLVREIPRYELEPAECARLKQGFQRVLESLPLAGEDSNHSYAAVFDDSGHFCALLERGIGVAGYSQGSSDWKIRFVM